MVQTGVRPMTEMEQKIASALAEIPAVERVHVLQDGNTCTVFTVIDDDGDEAAYDEIYEREVVSSLLCKRFSSVGRLRSARVF